MAADHDFEKSMQQKFDAFRLDPQPSDWLAVYEKLHPKRKGRIIWWWLPVFFGLGAVGIWMGNDPAGKGQGTASPKAAEKVVANETNAGEKVTDNDLVPKEIAASKSALESSNEQPIEQQEIGKSSLGNENLKMPNASEEGTHRTIDRQGKAKEKSEGKVAGNEYTINDSSTIKKKEILDDKQVAAKIENVNAVNYNSVEQSNDAEANDTNKVPKVADANSLPMIALSPATTLKENKDSSAAKKAQSKKNSSWKWATYAGMGANIIAQPIGSSKALADAGNFTIGSAVVSTTSNNQVGWHFAAGAMLEKRWKKGWTLGFGAGINYSTWSSDTETVKDSITPATAVYTRSVMSTANNHYRLWMAELPIQVSNRISGGPSLSFWWTAGINNQFLLGLKQIQELQSVSTNFTTVSNKNSLTSKATFYQPQLRLGFVFDRMGAKSHWQLQPIMNYTIPALYKSGNPSGTLVNLQLQYRMFLSR